MKKLFFAAIAALALVLSACDNTATIDTNDPNPYCWAIDVTVSMMGVTSTQTTYVWATGAELKPILEMMKAPYKGTDIDVKFNSKKVIAKDAEACNEKNIQI